MKAYKIELLVIDFEDIGEEEIVEIIENTKFISLLIKEIKSVDIGEWSDEHPLNCKDTSKEKYKKLFS